MRKKLGVSQKKFASLVGVSMGTIVGWESGKYKPRAEKVARLSELEKGGTETGIVAEGNDGKPAAPEKTQSKPGKAGSMERIRVTAKKGSAKRKGGGRPRRAV